MLLHALLLLIHQACAEELQRAVLTVIAVLFWALTWLLYGQPEVALELWQRGVCPNLWHHDLPRRGRGRWVLLSLWQRGACPTYGIAIYFVKGEVVGSFSVFGISSPSALRSVSKPLASRSRKKGEIVGCMSAFGTE